jgi:hypothetical protein
MPKQLKITLTVTDDVYPDTTTIEAKVTYGNSLQELVKHLPKSYFWSDYERATDSILEELRIHAKTKEKGNE